MADVLVQDSSLQNIANSIRGKNGETDKYKPREMAAEIDSISTGIDTSDATVVAAEIESGKTAYARGQKITGTAIPINTNYMVPSENILIGSSALIDGLRLRKTKESEVISSRTYIIPDNYFTLGTSWDELFELINSTSDYRITNKIASLINLTGNKILSGNTILNIAGTGTSDADATESDIASGMTAYVNGSKIEGTLIEGDVTLDTGLSVESTMHKSTPSFEIMGYATQKDRIVRKDEQAISVYPTEAQIAEAIELQANQIAENNVVLGVTGTYKGLDTSDATATADDIELNKTAYVNGLKLTGAMPVIAANGTVRGTEVTKSGSNIYITNGTKQILNQGSKIYIAESGIATAINLQASDIKTGVTILGIQGTCDPGIDTSDATATAADIASGKTAYINDQKVTGTLASLTSGTKYSNPLLINYTGGYLDITWNSSGKVILPGGTIFSISNSRVATAANIQAANIKKGTSIFGVAGTLEILDTSDADATVDDLLSGKTAYVNGNKITGTMRKYSTSPNLTIDTKVSEDTSNLVLSGTNDWGTFALENNGTVQVAISKATLANMIGLTADKIVRGVTVCGVTGTYVPDYEADGTLTPTDYSSAVTKTRNILGTGGANS